MLPGACMAWDGWTDRWGGVGCARSAFFFVGVLDSIGPHAAPNMAYTAASSYARLWVADAAETRELHLLEAIHHMLDLALEKNQELYVCF